MRAPGTFNIGGHNKLIRLSYFKSSKTTQKKHESGNAVTTTPAAAGAKVTADQKKDGNADSAAWTADQDEQLRKLKAGDGAQWKAIATALGKNVGDVKKRWGEIRPTTGGGEKKPGDKTQEAANTKKQRQRINKVFAALGGRSTVPGPKPDKRFTMEELELLKRIINEEFLVFGNTVAQRFHVATQREMNPMDLLGNFMDRK